MRDLIATTPSGLYCAAGGFHIDPWRPVERAVTTHAHSDHARAGSGWYLASRTGAMLLRARLGASLPVEGIAWGEQRRIGEVKVSLHPAGHVLGSAQVRVEHRGEVWVASGDYKRASDPTAEAFEVVKCDTFITESTFGLPIYRWRPPEEIAEAINGWWRESAELGRVCLITAYSLGKAQRVLSMLRPREVGGEGGGTILVHGAVEKMVGVYREVGIALPEVGHADKATVKAARSKGPVMVIAPPSAAGSAWMSSLGETEVGCASGWMAVRGARRRSNVDRGFVLSDHVDWPGVLETIAATGATRVGVTHGSTGPLVRFLKERGAGRGPLEAFEIKTRLVGEEAGPVKSAGGEDGARADASGDEPEGHE